MRAFLFIPLPTSFAENQTENSLKCFFPRSKRVLLWVTIKIQMWNKLTSLELRQFIPSALQNYKRHRQHNKSSPNFKSIYLCKSVAIGVIKNTWHTPRKSAYDGSIKCFGYCAYGPLLLAICVWIVHLCKQKKLQTIYCGRDGHLVDLYIKIAKNFGLDVETKYLLASRRVSRLIIKSKENLLSVLGQLKGLLTKNLKSYYRTI